MQVRGDEQHAFAASLGRREDFPTVPFGLPAVRLSAAFVTPQVGQLHGELLKKSSRRPFRQILALKPQNT